MGRRRKGPWRRSRDNAWCTTVNKKVTKLADGDTPYAEALKIYNRVMAESTDSTSKPKSLITMAEVIDDFLEWTSHNRSKRTYESYAYHLRRLYAHIGANFKAKDLLPRHVNKWVQKDYAGQSNNSRRIAYRYVERVLNWGRKNGYAVPEIHLEKPSQESSEAFLTPKEFAKVVALFDNDTDRCFHDYLMFLWETGCRPQEIKLLRAKHHDGEKFILEKKNSKGEKYNRVIYLSETANQIAKRLIKKHPTGLLFRNSKDNPWDRYSVKCRFRRVKKHTGLSVNSKMLRHSWATRVLTEGTVDTTTASLLMGHRDPATLARNYQHLTNNHDLLSKAANAASPSA